MSKTLNQKIKALAANWQWRFGKRTAAMPTGRVFALNKGCVNKIRFETWDEAKAANRTLYIYECGFCGGYHHTKAWPRRGRK